MIKHLSLAMLCAVAILAGCTSRPATRSATPAQILLRRMTRTRAFCDKHGGMYLTPSYFGTNADGSGTGGSYVTGKCDDGTPYSFQDPLLKGASARQHRIDMLIKTQKRREARAKAFCNHGHGGENTALYNVAGAHGKRQWARGPYDVRFCLDGSSYKFLVVKIPQ